MEEKLTTEPRYYCPKCGQFGFSRLHLRPDGSNCHYLARSCPPPPIPKEPA